MAQANIKAVITAKDDASDVLKKFGNNTNSLANGIGTALKSVAVVGTAVAAGIVAFGVSSVKSFQESENAIAQTNAVLKSTGGIAGVTAEEIDRLATSFQKTTTYSDEQVRSATNMLLTFTKIGKDIFPQATETVLNMSTALGQDLKSSSIQLGKALQDPILGVTALRRVGVNFSEDQQNVIKNLVETGRVAEAQKMILQELNTEFGGSASAAADTFAGSLARLTNQFDDVKESVGKTLVEGLTPLFTRLAEFLASDKFQAWLQEFLVMVSEKLPPFMDKLINEYIPNMKRAFDDAWPKIMAVANAIEFVIKTFIWLYDVQTNVLAAIMIGIDRWRTAFGNNLNVIVNELRRLNSIVGNAVTGSVNWLYDTGRNIIEGLIRGIRDGISGIGRAIGGANNAIGNAVKGALRGIIPGFATGVQNFSGGLAVVGERGPELVNLPRGADVIPNHMLNTGGGNTTFNITVQAGVMTGTDADMRRLSEMVVDSIKDIASARGTTAGAMLT